MVAFFICFAGVFAEFKVESPDLLRPVKIDVYPANYGIPGFYHSFGRLQQIDGRDFQELDNDVFAVYEEQEGICTADVARKVKKNGGKALVVIKEKLKLVAKDCEGEDPEILILGMEKKVYDYYLKKIEDVWVTYKYDMFVDAHPFIDIRFSGDRASDLEMIFQLIKVNSKFNLNKRQYRMDLMINEDFKANQTNCIETEKNRTYCYKNIGSTTGAQYIQAFALICSVFDHFQGEMNVFFYFLNEVFSNCHYETSCIKQNANKFNLSYVEDIDVIEKHIVYDSIQIGRFIVNVVNIYWHSYLETAYCLSIYDIPDSCEFCSPNCSFSALAGDECLSFCNTPKCGYGNLNCVKQSGCFSFMISDGYCNKGCIDDPDCNNYEEYMKVIFYSLLTCFIILVLVYVLFRLTISRIISAIRNKDLDLLETQTRNLSEINLKGHKIESITARICPIDLSEIGPDDRLIMTPCGHGFHEICFRNAVNSQESIEKKCPCCREKLKDFHY